MKWVRIRLDEVDETSGTDKEMQEKWKKWEIWARGTWFLRARDGERGQVGERKNDGDTQGMKSG